MLKYIITNDIHGGEGIFMSRFNYKVNISPEHALSLVKDKENADLVHEEMNVLENGRSIGTLVFEKYFFRVGNRAALVVIADNINGVTDVRVIATGSSQGMIFNFDWGAADSFAYSVEDILKDYIIPD